MVAKIRKDTMSGGFRFLTIVAKTGSEAARAAKRKHGKDFTIKEVKKTDSIYFVDMKRRKR